MRQGPHKLFPHLIVSSAMESHSEKHLLDALTKIRLFKCIEAPALRRIARHCRIKTYEQEAWIIGHGDETKDIYFIVEGNATVRIDSKEGVGVIFRELHAGDVFGEYAAIDRKPRSATVQARVNCATVLMSADNFRKAVCAEPDLAWALLEHLVLETRQLTDRVFEFSTLCVQNRVQAELLRIAKDSLESCSENQVEICPAPSDSEIASRISTHREAVNREIARLSKQSVLERHGRSIWIKNIAALEDMVHAAIGD